MLNIVSKIQNSLRGKEEGKGYPVFNFIKDKEAILKELSHSLEHGTLIGVYSRDLGEGMFLTGVDDIEDNGRQRVIVFETYDISGKTLNKTRISLEEIKMVCPFKIEYINPLLGKVKNVIVQH
jgi:hypothetical protein